MDPITFHIVPGTDKEYYAAFEKLRTDGGFGYDKATFGNLGEKTPQELAADEQFQEVLAQEMKVFSAISFRFAPQLSVNIRRQPDGQTLFDKVTVNRPDNADHAHIARITAALQKHLNATSVFNIGNLLGPAATQHFEAREIALSRLEILAAKLLEEMEDARKRREQEYEAKERTLEERFQKRSAELEEQARTRQEELDQQLAVLNTRSKELDDRAAKHARRQHYKDIKEKFNTWSEEFHLTKGTSGLRRHVYIPTLALMAVFAGLAGWFLFQSLSTENTTELVAAITAKVAFTLLFVSTAFFLIRWNNQWFQRHANEEFRLKRMELDVDRASWFVEMAFEWKDEKGEPIPMDLMQRLTQGLFSDGQSDHPVEPIDSLAQALLGAAKFKVKLGDGTEVEYDRKGVQELLRTR